VILLKALIRFPLILFLSPAVNTRPFNISSRLKSVWPTHDFCSSSLHFVQLLHVLRVSGANYNWTLGISTT